MSLRDFKSAEERKKHLETILKIKLAAVKVYPQNLEEEARYNCENMIGATSIPLGITGPLKIVTCHLSRVTDYYIPLATTEGALVASVNRGCKAITESGGAIVNAHQAGMTRGPVFYTGSIQDSERLYHWLKSHEDVLRQEAQKTSTHLKLKKIEIKSLSQYVFARFSYDTQDAMGMNMVTIATQKIVELIEKKTGFHCLSLAGNFDTDKKPSWLNFIDNRGWKIWAEAVIPEKTVLSVLKTGASKIHETWLAKCVYGSIMSGSMGFNAHFANVVAALFIATGQDAAHVVEGSLGITTTQVNGHSLYISVYLPDVCLGTIGGGTGLPSQKEALDILGISGGNEGKNALKFAEILGGAVLAGELSLLASLSEGSLATSHKRLARGKI